MSVRAASSFVTSSGCRPGFRPLARAAAMPSFERSGSRNPSTAISMEHLRRSDMLSRSAQIYPIVKTLRTMAPPQSFLNHYIDWVIAGYEGVTCRAKNDPSHEVDRRSVTISYNDFERGHCSERFRTCGAGDELIF
jgi:hypothetical protein